MIPNYNNHDIINMHDNTDSTDNVKIMLKFITLVLTSYSYRSQNQKLLN
jgi:hypothetical protein